MALDLPTTTETRDYLIMVLCTICELRPAPEDGTICGWCLTHTPETSPLARVLRGEVLPP